MCFPSKHQKDNFNDNTNQNNKPTKTETSAPTTSQKSQTPVLPPVTSEKQSNGKMPRQPKVCIIIYSMYLHIAKMAEGVKVGIERAGGTCTIYQVAETLSDEVLTKMSAAPKPDYPIITLDEWVKYDAFLFGIPTRYGVMPAQIKALLDSTPKLWGQGALHGKYCGVFFSTAGPGGGQETTAMTFVPYCAHHGIVFVPLGYYHNFELLTTSDYVHGGSPWGAGTFSKSDGSRVPTPEELKLAGIQGEQFWKTVARVDFDVKLVP